MPSPANHSLCQQRHFQTRDTAPSTNPPTFLTVNPLAVLPSYHPTILPSTLASAIDLSPDSTLDLDPRLSHRRRHQSKASPTPVSHSRRSTDRGDHETPKQGLKPAIAQDSRSLPSSYRLASKLAVIGPLNSEIPDRG